MASTAPTSTSPADTIPEAEAVTKATFLRHAAAHGLGFCGVHHGTKADALAWCRDHDQPEASADAIAVSGYRLARTRKDGRTSYAQLDQHDTVWRVGHCWLVWSDYPASHGSPAHTIGIIYRSPCLPAGATRAPARTSPAAAPADTSPEAEAARTAWEAGERCPLSTIPAVCGRRPRLPDVIDLASGQYAEHRGRGYVTDGRVVLAVDTIRSRAARDWAARVQAQPVSIGAAFARVLPSILAEDRTRTKAVAIQRLQTTLPPALHVVHVDGQADHFAYSLPRYRWILRHVRDVASLAMVAGRLGMLAFCDAAGAPVALLMPVTVKGGHKGGAA